jgi:quercetin dioxygenase-like cupin family protein
MLTKKQIGMYEDDRGHLLWTSPKLLNFNYKYLTLGTINPGCRRGGHYHKKMKEMIMCVSGKIIFQLENESLELEAGEVTNIPINMVHTVYNEKENKEVAVFIEFKDEEFEMIKEDTYTR